MLAKVAHACPGAIRDRDLVGRVGGEEFALLLACGEMGVAQDIVDRLRAQGGAWKPIRRIYPSLRVTLVIVVGSQQQVARSSSWPLLFR